MNEIHEPKILIQNIVDAADCLIMIIEGTTPIMMNKALRDFFAVSSFEQYSKDFGSFVNNFIPHNSYFQSGKIEEGETWIEALLKLGEEDRIVSMINSHHEPRAFSVQLDNSHKDYVIVNMRDISASLIKRIMIENDVSIDQNSGAYNKEYFIHTSELLQDGAAFNEKSIGITMMNVLDSDIENLTRLVTNIKANIRQNDMVVKWSRGVLLLAYLVDTKENALLFTKKLQAVTQTELMGLALTLVKKGESITNATKRVSAVLPDLEGGELKVL
jgi:hypothetical protein